MTMTPYPGDSHWPADFQGCTLTGTYVGLDGQVVSGNITFVCPADVLLDYGNNKVILPRSLTVTLDSNGSFSIMVPATDDPDISPNGWTYSVIEHFVGGRTYSIEAPQNTTVDITDAAPVPDAQGNPIVRGPRGIDGVVQNVKVNGRLGTIDLASDADISDLVLDPENNLSDLTSVAAAWLNLGLDSAASHPDTDFATPAELASTESEISNINARLAAGPDRLQAVFTGTGLTFGGVALSTAQAKITAMSVLPGDKGMISATIAGGWTTGTADSQFVVPAGHDGQWRASALITVAPIGSASDRIRLHIRVNGVTVFTAARYCSATTTNPVTVQIVPFEMSLDPGDVVDMSAESDANSGWYVQNSTNQESYLRLERVAL